MKKKLAIALVCILLIGVVGGTLAYLTSQDSVTNTFTVGNVQINLDEAEIKDGVATGERTETGNEYHLLPGHSYDKDPTIHVDAESEACWLFVKVDNQIAGIEAAGDTTIAAQMAAKGWTLVSGETNVYAYKDIAKAGDDVKVFETFKIGGNGVTNDILATYEDAEIIVTAYAIQAAGFDTAADAWTTAKSELK